MELSQVLVKELGEEGGEWRHQHSHRQQDFVKRGDAGECFLVPFLALETGAVQPDVPREEGGGRQVKRGRRGKGLNARVHVSKKNH